MKKTLLACALGLAFAANAEITEVADLYSGASVAVTWENTLKIEADKFADAAAGNYIMVALENATDVIEFKANGTWVPGSRLHNINEATEAKLYLTADGVAAVKEHGLELCGASFTVTGAKLMNDGFVMPEGAVWGGFFWVDNWNTLELWKTAFDSYKNQKYMDVYLSDDNGDNTGYFMKVLTKWDDDNAIIANNEAITHEAKKALIDLSNVNLTQALADVNALMIQSNPEGGAPYNITAVVLRDDEQTNLITNVAADETTEAPVYNLQGVMVRRSATSTEGLPAGIYIFRGAKVAVK